MEGTATDETAIELTSASDAVRLIEQEEKPR